MTDDASPYLVRERPRLLEGPLARYELELDPASIPRLAAAHGLDVGGPPSAPDGV